SRSWTALSKPASSARKRKASSSAPNGGRIRRVRLLQFHANNARPLDFPYDSLVWLHHPEIELAIRRNENYFRPDDDKHGHIVGFAGGCEPCNLASERLPAPSVGKAGIAAYFDAILRGRQYKLRLARLPMGTEPLVHEPQTTVRPAFSRSIRINQATVS